MNNLKKAALACAIIGTTLSHQAAAEDAGFYIGIAAARTDFNTDFNSDVNFDDDDTTVHFNAGYMFNSFVGVDIGYAPIADESFSNANLDATAYTVQGVLSVPVAIVDIYGKLGVAAVDVEFDAPGFREDEIQAFATGTVGVELDLGNFNIFTEYNRIDADEVDINTARLGVKIEF